MTGWFATPTCIAELMNQILFHDVAQSRERQQLMKIVGFLQNAWSEAYAGGTWPRHNWLKALERSRSGQRLRVLTKCAEGVSEYWWDNTTPIVGAEPKSIVAPDLEHMQRVLDEQKPAMTIAFGKQAMAACLSLGIEPLLILPHPAYRVVTNKLFIEAGHYLSDGEWFTRSLFRQERDGKVTIIQLEVDLENMA